MKNYNISKNEKSIALSVKENHIMSKYTEQYPWLRLRSLYTGEICTETDAYDDIMEGWQIAFGEMMLKELDKAIREKHLEDEFVFEQVKEKFGRLVMYVNVSDPDINNILDKYAALSENICMNCGKPDVPMLNMSWISPICEECYNKMTYRHGPKRCEVEPYETVASKDARMAEKLKYTRYSKGARYDVEIDISATAEAIRKQYQERTK